MSAKQAGFLGTRRTTYLFATLVVAALILAVAAAFPGLANGADPRQASPGYTFVGSATIDGSPAPQGTVIDASINGSLVASVEVGADGEYPMIAVEGATDGDTVTFTIGGLPAVETATVMIGKSDVLHLTAIRAAAPTNTTVPPTHSSVTSAFRVGPTVRLRPVNDVIDKDMDGIVEILFRNPVLNDTTMVVDMTVSIPSGFHLYGEGFATDTAAGAASGSFQVPPGQSRTIFLNIKAEKTGRSTVHFSGTYWPEGNKDLFNPVSLTHPFVVNEPSPDPFTASPTNPNQVSAAPAPTTAPPPVATAAPVPVQQGDPSASCSLSPGVVGSNGAGDLALLGLPLLGLLGLRRSRRGS